MLSSPTTYAAEAPILVKHPSSVRRASAVETLVPIMAVVLVAFLIIGLALPVLPLHVHQGLDFGTFAVGVFSGNLFAASLFSRVWSGNYADGQGPKRAV